MSFRLHGGPKLLTLIHDARSPASERIRRMLQARVKPNNGTDGPSSSSPARVFLDKTANEVPTEAPFSFDIVDRTKATPGQWETIASFMQCTRQSQVEALKDEEGPLLVNWDDGQVCVGEQDAKMMVDRLTEELNSKEAMAGSGGKGCSVM